MQTQVRVLQAAAAGAKSLGQERACVSGPARRVSRRQHGGRGIPLRGGLRKPADCGKDCGVCSDPQGHSRV